MLRSILQNSTAGFYIFASDSTTPTSGKTGLTITTTLSKVGGTANSVSPTITEIGNGLYWVAPITAHRDTLGEIAWQFSGTGAIIAPRLEKVVAVNDQTARFGASDGTGVTLAADQAVNTTKWGGTAVASANVLIDGAITAAKIASDAITAAKVASDAVTEIQSGLSTLDAAGIRTAIGLALANLDSQLAAIAGYIDTEVAAIKSKTDNLPNDPADQSLVEAAITSATSGLASQASVDTLASYVDTEVAAIKAKTDNLPADPADASDIAASFSTVNTKLDTIDDFLDTEVAAIKAKTDNLPADPADASDIAASFASIASSIATLTTYVDTEVAAIKAKTDNLPSDPADQSAVEAAITAAASLLATAAELAKVPKVGSTHRYTQVANNTGAKTADVSISVIP